MSYKAIFAIAAALDLELEQMDVKTAFLYGDIDEEVYMEQPPEFDDGTGRVCKLNKALYGLKQAPRIWYQTLAKFLESLGFYPLTSGVGIFVKGHTYIAVYVDDLLIAGPRTEEIQQLKTALGNRFQMTDLGPCSHYLGMVVTRDRKSRTIRLSQKAYIEKILKDFGMCEAKPQHTPMKTDQIEIPDNYEPTDESRHADRIRFAACYQASHLHHSTHLLQSANRIVNVLQNEVSVYDVESSVRERQIADIAKLK
ncbi:Gag-Pol polyprotein [Purpureocillium lavendulum]|uniref:Gag-Pol polyprotein n=1 Tax=Purpureocillium lavendulum TaxID=1247861 RepID=A0AB34FBS7_9HYPO|nr:Gag-Pol polyprotein [Purpureocillium lavendulum]